MKLKSANNILGILLMICAMICFSCMDGVIRYLSQYYNVITIGMFRYWFFALFIIFINIKKKHTFKSVAKSNSIKIQILRSIILTTELCLAHYCYFKIGLIQASCMFAVGPLFVTILSVFILKEKISWRICVAIMLGFIGILIILRPGIKEFELFSLIALGCAFLYAVYVILTRFVSRYDNNNTTFFYTGIIGAVILSFIGPFFYVEVLYYDWAWIFIICVLGVLANFCIIKSLQLSEASVLQPFTYLHLVFVSIIGVLVFSEILDIYVLLGSLLIVSSGLYILWKEHLKNLKIFNS